MASSSALRVDAPTLLTSLDGDVLTLIVMQLDIIDVLHLTTTSKLFKQFSSLPGLWNELVARDFFTEITDADRLAKANPNLHQMVQNNLWELAYKEAFRWVPRLTRVSLFEEFVFSAADKDMRHSIDNVCVMEIQRLPYPQGHNEDYDVLLKFSVVGEIGVGKSMMILRYADNNYPDRSVPTICFDFKLIRLQASNNVRFKIQLWDYFSRSAFHMVPAGYIRGSVGICVCFDVTNRKSFERLDIWITQVQSHKSDYSTIILVGCKSDAPPEERQISYEEGVKLAEIYGWQYTETSSKLNRGVTELFEDLASTVYMNLHGSEHRDQIVPPHLRKPADSARTKKSGGGVGGWFKKILGWK